MARRTHLVRALLASSVLGLALTAAPLAAGAQEAPTTPTLAQLLDGQVDGLTAEATTVSGPDGGMGIELEVTNTGDDPVAVAIPFGTLVVTEAESDQTMTVTPPPTDEVVEVAASGGTPTIDLDPGTTTHDLPAYCTELDDGFTEGSPVAPIDDAHPVLADTLRAALVAGTDDYVTQDAVWWLTDEPTLPVDEEIASVLEVDTAAFAAAPHRVTPDTGYVPLWMRSEVPAGDLGTDVPDEDAAGILDESFQGQAGTSSSDGSGAGVGPAVWLLLVGLVVVTAVVIAARSGKRTPTPVLAPVNAAGWYPDPWGSGGHRWWDGRSWTARVLPPR